MRAVVIEEWELIAAGVGAVLAELGIETVARARDGRAGVQAARTLGAELVVVGRCGDVEAAVRGVAGLPTRPLVLVLLSGRTDPDLARLLAIGAHGLLLRSASSDDLALAVNQVLAGERSIAPALLPQLLSRVDTAASAGPTLSRRERQVLEQLAQGLSNKEIAEALYLGEETVKSHLSRLYAKLEATDRRDAVARALAVGLLG